jgi:hypothetical protein
MAFSFWIYIKSWNYKYGLDKVILFWEGSSPNDINDIKDKCKEITDTTFYDKSDTQGTTLKPKRSLWRQIPDKCIDNCKEKRLLETITIENFNSSDTPKLKIGGFKGLKVFLRKEDNCLVVKKGLINNTYENIIVEKLDIQKWLNVTINMDLRNLDIFINGNLRSSRFFDSIPNLHTGPLIINPYGGFDGKLSKLHYFNNKLKIDYIKFLYNRGHKKNNLLLFKIPKKVKDEINIKDIDFNIHKTLITNNTWNLNKTKKKSLNINDNCNKTEECKGSLKCIDNRCNYEQQSRQRNNTCWTNSDCLYGLTCNNWGNNNIKHKDLKQLKGKGLNIKSEDKWNSKLSKKPFVCY